MMSEVRCNACGRTWDTERELFEAQEVEPFEVTGGYGNRQWGDCVAVGWRACQDCLAAWFRGFAVPPEAFEVEPWVPGRRPRAIPFDLPPEVVALHRLADGLTLEDLRRNSVPVVDIEDAVK